MEDKIDTDDYDPDLLPWVQDYSEACQTGDAVSIEIAYYELVDRGMTNNDILYALLQLSDAKKGSHLFIDDTIGDAVLDMYNRYTDIVNHHE